MWGPVRVDGVSQFPIYRELGVGIFQYTLSWAAWHRHARPTRATRRTRPTAPEELEFAVAEARRHGIKGR